MAAISVNPENSYGDERLVIKVTNLDARQSVTLHSRQVSHRGKSFQAYAFYEADDNGSLNLTIDKSTGGSYTGVEPMGLLWGMRETPRQKKNHSALIMSDVNTPADVFFSVFEGFQNLCHGVRPEMTPLTSLCIKRWCKTSSIERTYISDADVDGVLFYPRDKKNLPGVIDLGGTFEMRSALLARHGFAVFCLNVRGPEQRSVIDLEVIDRASDLLQSREEVRKNGLGIIGVSLFGSAALAAAACVRGVTRAVNIAGPITAFRGSDFKYKDQVWRSVVADESKVEVKENVRYQKNALDIPNSFKLPKHMPDFHKSKSSLLFAYGSEDGLFRWEKTLDLARELFKATGKKNYKIIVCAGAGHLLLPPYIPLMAIRFMEPFHRLPTHFGGRIKEHAHAQEQLWREIIDFLK